MEENEKNIFKQSSFGTWLLSEKVGISKIENQKLQNNCLIDEI